MGANVSIGPRALVAWARIDQRGFTANCRKIKRRMHFIIRISFSSDCLPVRAYLWSFFGTVIVPFVRFLRGCERMSSGATFAPVGSARGRRGARWRVSRARPSSRFCPSARLVCAMAMGEREAELEVSVVSSETRTASQGEGVAERGDETLRAQMRCAPAPSRGGHLEICHSDLRPRDAREELARVLPRTVRCLTSDSRKKRRSLRHRIAFRVALPPPPRPTQGANARDVARTSESARKTSPLQRVRRAAIRPETPRSRPPRALSFPHPRAFFPSRVWAAR